MKSNGVYSQTLERVRGLKADGVLVIDAKELKEEIRAGIDKRDFDKDELLDFFCSYMAAVVLSQEQCYSLKRRKGKYINIAAAVDANIFFGLMKNKDIDIHADEKTKQRIFQRLREVQANIVPGQYQFDLADPSNISPVESIEEMIQRASN